MAKVAVVYWSGTGNTEYMANSIVEGAKGAGAEVETFTAGDFSSAKVAEFDVIPFGCPSMGEEVLEESEFAPMWDEVKGELSGKKVALFGSYGWGDGEWMRNWVAECNEIGATLIGEGLMINETPDDEGVEECKALGASLA